MTLESFEWGVILHLERQPGKLRQKQKNPLSHQLPLKVYKWSVNRNEFLLGFRHHLLRWERDKKKRRWKRLENYAYLKAKCFPSATWWKCTKGVRQMLTCYYFSWGLSLRSECKELLGCSLEYEWKCTARLDALPEKLWLYSMMKRKRKCVLNRGLEPRFPGCLPDVLCYEWAHLISLSQFHSGK